MNSTISAWRTPYKESSLLCQIIYLKYFAGYEKEKKYIQMEKGLKSLKPR